MDELLKWLYQMGIHEIVMGVLIILPFVVIVMVNKSKKQNVVKRQNQLSDNSYAADYSMRNPGSVKLPYSSRRHH